MRKAEEQARYDAAIGFAQRAIAPLHASLSRDNKLSQIIIAYVLLEGAIYSIGEDNVQAVLDADPASKNIVGGIQHEVSKTLGKLHAMAQAIDEEPENLIFVDFKNPNASSPR